MNGTQDESALDSSASSEHDKIYGSERHTLGTQQKLIWYKEGVGQLDLTTRARALLISLVRGRRS